MKITGIVALVLLILSVPIGIALSAASAAYILVDPLLQPEVIFRAFFNFISRYSLMAIPLFIFAGFLMERTGLVAQLFRFADALVGWMPGGFGVATVLACVLFGAISGSSVAMAAAMAVIAIPEMKKRGYPDWLSAGLVATAGGIAMLIPAEHHPAALRHRDRDVGDAPVFCRHHPGAHARRWQCRHGDAHRHLPEAAAYPVRGARHLACDAGRAARPRDADRDSGRTLRRTFHAHRGGGGGLRLRAGLRTHQSAAALL